MKTLQQYITDCQRLVHDSQYKFCTQAEMIDYVNAGRRKVAAETGCVRQVVTGWTLTATTKTIDYTTLVTSRRATAILDIYLWASTGLRIPLRYFPYSVFSRSAIVMYNYQGLPEMWSQVNPGLAYVARIPDIDYTVDFDLLLETTALAAVADEDTEIMSPFDECVKYYMAHLVKMKNQQFEEANYFLSLYEREKAVCNSSSMVRKLVGS